VRGEGKEKRRPAKGKEGSARKGGGRDEGSTWITRRGEKKNLHSSAILLNRLPTFIPFLYVNARKKKSVLARVERQEGGHEAQTTGVFGTDGTFYHGERWQG